jgi:hypothetical protein
MALSDQMSKLAARAHEAESRAAAAREKARAQLERDVAHAREAAQAQADELKATRKANEANVAAWWNDRIAEVRADLDAHRTERDVKKAHKRAERAEDYAAEAVALAYTAVVEAEYAMLDATLARMDADQLSEAARAAA